MRSVLTLLTASTSEVMGKVRCVLLETNKRMELLDR
jgi:hypothetical protein